MGPAAAGIDLIGFQAREDNFMQLRNVTTFVLGAVLAVSAVAAAADNPAAQGPQPDVTITVIPDGQDVLKTVVQNIMVPPGKGGSMSQFGQQTASTAKQKEEQKESSQAQQHEAAPASGQQGEESAEQARQQAEEIAEQQASQAQQQAQAAQQQAEDAKQAAKPKPPSPPKPPGPPILG